MIGKEQYTKIVKAYIKSMGNDPKYFNIPCWDNRLTDEEALVNGHLRWFKCKNCLLSTTGNGCCADPFLYIEEYGTNQFIESSNGYFMERTYLNSENGAVKQIKKVEKWGREHGII